MEECKPYIALVAAGEIRVERRARVLQTSFSEFVNHARLVLPISLSSREFTARRSGVPLCVEKADWHARIADRR